MHSRNAMVLFDLMSCSLFQYFFRSTMILTLVENSSFFSVLVQIYIQHYVVYFTIVTVTKNVLRRVPYSHIPLKKDVSWNSDVTTRFCRLWRMNSAKSLPLLLHLWCLRLPHINEWPTTKCLCSSLKSSRNDFSFIRSCKLELIWLLATLLGMC